MPRQSVIPSARHRAWMAALPEVQKACAARWQLALGTAYQGGPLSHVQRVTGRDGAPFVLKLAPPSPSLAQEIQALLLWTGNGAVRLAAADLDLGALLLERAEPGLPLSSLCAETDVEATAAAAHAIRALHHVPASRASGLSSVAEWITRLERVPSTVPFELGRASREAVREGSALLDTHAPSLVLHGDLHHWNLLSAERAPWLAIDPKGVTGPAEAEAAALLRNPRPFVLGHPRPAHLIAERIRVLAEVVRLDPAAVRSWGWVLAVVAAWWSFEDGERDWEPWLACAAAIQRSG